MAHIQWKDRYDINYKEIDDQHKGLVGILNHMIDLLDQEPDADAIRGVWTRIESEIVEFRGVTRAKVSGTFYFAVPFCRWYADIVFT